MQLSPIEVFQQKHFRKKNCYVWFLRNWKPKKTETKKERNVQLFVLENFFLRTIHSFFLAGCEKQKNLKKISLTFLRTNEVSAFEKWKYWEEQSEDIMEKFIEWFKPATCELCSRNVAKLMYSAKCTNMHFTVKSFFYLLIFYLHSIYDKVLSFFPDFRSFWKEFETQGLFFSNAIKISSF